LPPELAAIPARRRVEALRLKVEAKVYRQTNVLEVSYVSKDSRAAARMVDAVVAAFKWFEDELQKTDMKQRFESLTKDQVETAGELKKVKQRGIEARERMKYQPLGFTPEGNPVMDPRLEEAAKIHGQYINLKIEIENHAQILRALQSADNLGPHLLAIVDVIGGWEQLRSLLGLSGQETGTAASLEHALREECDKLNKMVKGGFGPNHPEVIAQQQKIDEIKRSAQEISQRFDMTLADPRTRALILQKIQSRWDQERAQEENLRDKEAQASNELTEFWRQSGELADLRQNEKFLERQYEQVQQDLRQIRLPDQVRIEMMENPVIADQPVSPHLSQVALITLLLGLGTALAVVNALDTLDDRFRTMEELQGRLGVPMLSVIHRLESSETPGVKGLMMFTDPTAIASEAFRTLRTAISLSHSDAHRIAITSTEPGDGKTTILANLSVCYAQAEKKTVLVIDADIRKPGLTRLMDMRGERGLSEVLRSEAEIGPLAMACIRSSGMPGLDVLPCGPRVNNPAELLTSPRLSELLAWAETRYDHVFVDCPPALVTTDLAIVGQIVDGILLVVDPLKNRRRGVMRVVDKLNWMKLPILGLVVNRIPTGEKDHYGYGYGYGYGDGYGYGYSDHDGGEDREGQRHNRADAPEPSVIPVNHPPPPGAPRPGLVPTRVA
jgi:capsular exopolysaccharide synthesis family protein